MHAGLLSFLFSTFTVVLAEMGDKTQLLAMAFAARYRWWKVLLGVFVATILNHALAVALGNLLGRIEALHMIIQIGLILRLHPLRAVDAQGRQDR